MKCYVFVNSYLKGIDVGIQAAHAIARLATQCSADGDFMDFERWEQKHSTIIVLNGGGHDRLEETMNFLTDNEGGAGLWDEEVGVFREPGLNNTFTAVAIVANETVCAIMQELKEDPEYSKNCCTPDFKLAEFLSKQWTHKG